MDDRVEDAGFFWVEETNGQLSVPMKMKRKVRPKKMEFLGWGSKPLIEFLQSIGKDTSKQLSQYEVTAIINEYVKLKNLINPEKKKRILCDEKLHYLFGKKSVLRIKIHDLLDAHFSGNQDESEDGWYSSEDNEGSVCKEQKTPSSDRKPLHQKKKISGTPRSCFAALVSENIKHVYLRRSLVQDILKYPETFEAKITGSFVRIKADPNDYSQKNSHQLLQIIGVKFASGDGDIGKTEILLQASNFLKDIRICMLSDDNFTEEECEDLRQRVKAGLLKKPTVAELERKTEMLHEDITKHWLVREVALLQNLIDRANEKGWRKELFEYLERKQLLQTPSEQSRLLSEVPEIIAEEIETEDTQTPKSESEKPLDNHLPGSTHKGSPEIAVNGVEGDLATKSCGSEAATGLQTYFEISRENNDMAGDQPADFVLENAASVLTWNNSRVEMPLATPVESMAVRGIPDKRVTETQVIELSDDDGEVDEGWNGGIDLNVGDNRLHSPMWHYLDPQGVIQGPFSVTSLKRWSDAEYFDPGFEVWKTGQSPHERVLLKEVLREYFPI